MKMVSIPFQRPIGLLALAGVLIFIALYLRRPKPKDRVIPSLMFIMQDSKKSRQFSFFQRLMTNILFLLQILSIISLGLVAAAPYIKLNYDTTKENTVLIIDVSASMQAKENGISRFDKAIAEAKNHVSGRNSIILAENVPLIVLEEESDELALDVISKIRPKGTTTNLGDALLLAKDLIGENPGRIVVLSDFLPTEGPDVQVVKTAITTDDRLVDFIDVSNKVNNVGITSMETNKYNTKVYAKNFDSQPAQRTVKLIKDSKEITSAKIAIGPNSIENFVFDTPSGLSKVELEPKDGLELDDVAYIATPSKTKILVLLITSEKNSNLERALSAAKDIDLNVANPPVITININKKPIDTYKHDVIIIYKIGAPKTKDGLLPSDIDGLQRYVDNGGNLIIASQENLKDLKLDTLNVIDLKLKINKATKACIEAVNQVTKQFEKERCFTTLGSYYSAESRKGTITFASTEDKNPILVYGEKKKGKVAYYGIIDDTSEFKSLPAYPIFWNSLMNFMVGMEDIKDYNFKTGKIFTIGQQKVKTPSQTITTNKVLMDETGIYEFDNRRFASNLLDEKESNVNINPKVDNQRDREHLLLRESKEHDFNLEVIILVIVFIFMMSEFFYIKIRGDI